MSSRSVLCHSERKSRNEGSRMSDIDGGAAQGRAKRVGRRTSQSLDISLSFPVLVERQAFGVYNAKQCARNRCKSKTSSTVNLLSQLEGNSSTTSNRRPVNRIRRSRTATHKTLILRLLQRRRRFAIGRKGRRRSVRMFCCESPS